MEKPNESNDLRSFIRFLGIFCLFFAFLAWQSWQDGVSRIESIEQPITIQPNQQQAMPITFIPKLEATYLIRLKFDQSQYPAIDCAQITPPKLQWEITENGKAVQWVAIKRANKNTKEASCYRYDSIIASGFDLEKFNVDQPHLLNFWQAANSQNTPLKAILAITPFGIGVHYAFADLALQELLLGILIIVSLGCFLPDLAGLIRRKLGKH